ncbi:MAG TPA: hypothetical protein VFS43_25670 [Polyangiaceae bacterium]|nr:hypothetical protein [Polyangiaceae bacterium]
MSGPEAVSGVTWARWVWGLAPAHEGQSVADFFDAFPWDGASDDEALTSVDFFAAFGDEDEAPAPSTLRGYGADGTRGGHLP